jgi:hypothetical protein
MLEKEFQYFVTHQKELVKQYNGKYIVIKDEQVIGAYPSNGEALEETVKEHKLGTFLIQFCAPGIEVYTQEFHSRVVF